ncbi:hypothetical protein K2Y00_04045 [Patescibacteria group bacterium]|nr:hypothetical protein [Patescibacteria group bacterium]
MSTAEHFETAPQNLRAALLKELETKGDLVTVEYDDGNAAYEGLVVRISGTPSRLQQYFHIQTPHIRRYRIVPPGEPPVGDK